MSDEQATEKKIRDKGLNAPRLSPANIDAVIVSETFTTLPSGKCMVCELTLVNGFTVRGESATVSKENFDIEIGQDISRKDARDKVWGFEGYLLQQRLHEDGSDGPSPFQERKYTFTGGKIVNRATGVAIPDNEPIMIFRAKDMMAPEAILAYRNQCHDENHKKEVAGLARDFYAFQQDNPDLCKLPDSDPSCLPGVDKFVMDDIARVAHEINRAYCEALGDTSQPSWEEAPAWQRESARAGVDFHLMFPEADPEAIHVSWLSQKEADGWVFGEVKDPEAKTHPCIIPFSELPTEQQAKDFLFRAVVHALQHSR